jgi:N-acetylmuramoyl-L-alanine amidase
MRNPRSITLALLASLLFTSSASASVAHTVEPGETLWSIAAADGLSPSALAAANGLSSDAQLVAGTTVQIPDAGPATPPAMANAPATVPTPTTAPAPATQSITSTDVRSIAASNGVPASLAAAIAWQESGFNNAMVSGADARGVMQVTPGTWQWVQQNVASSPLDPSSSTDNVKAGVLYLRQLLQETGGDPAQAAAAYYQGPASLRARGMLPATRQYVSDVMALRSRFGGP